MKNGAACYPQAPRLATFVGVGVVALGATAMAVAAAAGGYPLECNTLECPTKEPLMNTFLAGLGTTVVGVPLLFVGIPSPSTGGP